MKKSLLALAVLGTFAGVAQAQSSVTLYGVVDANVEYVNHEQNVTAAGAAIPGSSGSRLAMQAGGLSSNRWGLRGIEDLGGGLKSLFVLESGFSMDDGKLQQGGRLFGRQAFVGLQGDWGKITLGRQYTTIFDMMANFSPSGYATQWEPVVGLLGANFREDNVIKYTGAFGPLTVEGHWSFGERAGSNTANSAYGIGANYFAGPFGLGVAYDEVKVLSAQEIGGAPGNDYGRDKRAAVAASYTVGPVKVMGGYRYGNTAAPSTGTPALTPHRDDLYWLGVNYQATTALGLTLSYYYDNIKEATIAGTTVNPRKPQQWNFIADYNFSKRTDVYLTAAYSRNGSLNWDSIGYTPTGTSVGYLPAASQTYFITPDSNNQVGVAVGVRHKF
ncbi:MAG: porin [Pseudomonadota bacterium]|uniref:porin n=1 Tax=Ralstonia pickettii TaxID=329 RepID=UPI0015C133CF|nr:porin [Ralstonia pickettii]MEE2978420.1 porin [Pseudomonadota bacterium]NWK46308.1 porin [Ralstonia pickettii]WKZ84773.1 porin [Ralstonia pickettii]